MIDRSNLVAFDIETWGREDLFALQPFRAKTRDAWLMSCAMAHYSCGVPTAASYRTPSVEFLRGWLRECSSNKKFVVAWNAPFDVAFLIALGLREEVYAVNWLDGLLLERHTHNAPRFRPEGQLSMGLKQSVARYWPERAGYDDDVTFNPQTEEEWVKLVTYNEDDAVNTLELAAQAIERLSPEIIRNAMIEARCIPMVAETIVDGITMNRDTAVDLAARLEQTRHTAELALRMLTEHQAEDLPEILASPKKLSKLLFEDWGLPIVGYTDKGQPSTDKEALTQLAVDDVRAQHVHNYREAANNRTKFCVGTIESLDYNGDGCTRPQARIFGTYTGRVTYSSKTGRGVAEQPTGVALHQWKRDPAFRSIVEAPVGYTLIEADFAGQEFRWMAVESGDATMLSLCAPGEDAHAYMAAAVRGCDYRELQHANEAGEPWAKPIRQLGKVANLCIAEGTTILTDRGPCNIEHVRKDDRVWDGEAFVAHDGVTFSGYLPVITHQGVTSTPDHKVLVDQQWVRNDEAARHGWTIEPALGAGRQSSAGAAVRILGGLICRAVREARRAVCEGALRVWARAGDRLAHAGDRPLDTLQSLRYAGQTSGARPHGRPDASRAPCAEAGERLVSAVSKPEARVLAQLRRAGDRVQVRLGEGGRGLCAAASTPSDVPKARHRPTRQRGTLRAWKLALGLSRGEPRQPSTARCYDIVNCGPRRRFAANGVIVHNSLQYRTSARTLMVVAAVQHKTKLTLPEAQRIYTTYQRTYRQVPVYWKRQIAQARSQGWVQTLAGRRVNLGTPDTWVYSDGNSAQWSHESTAVNFPIQGIGADQKYLALLVLRDYLPRVNGRFYFELHDGLFVVVPDEHAERAAQELKTLLSNLPYKKAWGVDLPIQFPVDVKMGKTWGTLKEVH